jgi:hypothetical protein
MCDSNPKHLWILGKLNDAISNPQNTTTEKKQLERAKLVYEQNCQTCRKGSNDSICLQLALDELLRMMPDKRGDVYPWRNYEWDYTNYVNNNYSARATGSSEDAGLFKNMSIFVKLIRGFISDPNPADDSIAGGTSIKDRASDFPVFECDGKEKRCESRLEVTRNSPSANKPPYKDPFFDKSLTGTRSSSYFVKIGKCDRPDITSAEECTKRGYDWNHSKDECTQGRYAYMDNSPSSVPLMRGYIPSVASDAISLTSPSLGLAYRGYNSYGMKIQECPNVIPKETIEKFDDGSNTMNIMIFTWGFLAGLLIYELYIDK